jgi:hypothetical protein
VLVGYWCCTVNCPAGRLSRRALTSATMPTSTVASVAELSTHTTAAAVAAAAAATALEGFWMNALACCQIVLWCLLGSRWYEWLAVRVYLHASDTCIAEPMQIFAVLLLFVPLAERRTCCYSTPASCGAFRWPLSHRTDCTQHSQCDLLAIQAAARQPSPASPMPLRTSLSSFTRSDYQRV